MLGIERGGLISETILGMREIADELGLKGNVSSCCGRLPERL